MLRFLSVVMLDHTAIGPLLIIPQEKSGACAGFDKLSRRRLRRRFVWAREKAHDLA
jgi:hypothetical protein